MKLETIWIVTKPTELSTLVDICFSTSVNDLHLYYAGGLDNVIGFYTTEEEAVEVAEGLL